MRKENDEQMREIEPNYPSSTKPTGGRK